jgi:regulator of protease activity HflC (stomatin/prohibitin superfamily)
VVIPAKEGGAGQVLLDGEGWTVRGHGGPVGEGRRVRVVAREGLDLRVSLRTVTMDIPPQDVITKDNGTVRVNAVTYFNVVDPNRSVVAIEDHIKGTSQIAQTRLRSILGQVDLDELLINRDEINQRLQQIIDRVTNPWGVTR